MSLTLTDQFIADTYGGVIHSQGAKLSGDGGVGEVTMLFDGEGNETSMAIGKKGAGVSIFCDLSACGTVYLEGVEIRDVIDSRTFWEYSPENQKIHQKTLAYEDNEQPINGVVVQQLSADTFNGFEYPTVNDTPGPTVGSVMTLGEDNKIELKPFVLKRDKFIPPLTKEHIIFCIIGNGDIFPITADTLNIGPGAYSDDRIAGDTIKVMGIRHGGSTKQLSYIAINERLVKTSRLRYRVEKFIFNGTSWVGVNSTDITGEFLGNQLFSIG